VTGSLSFSLEQALGQVEKSFEFCHSEGCLVGWLLIFFGFGASFFRGLFFCVVPVGRFLTPPNLPLLGEGLDCASS